MGVNWRRNTRATKEMPANVGKGFIERLGTFGRRRIGQVLLASVLASAGCQGKREPITFHNATPSQADSLAEVVLNTFIKKPVFADNHLAMLCYPSQRRHDLFGIGVIGTRENLSAQPSPAELKKTLKEALRKDPILRGLTIDVEFIRVESPPSARRIGAPDSFPATTIRFNKKPEGEATGKPAFSMPNIKLPATHSKIVEELRGRLTDNIIVPSPPEGKGGQKPFELVLFDTSDVRMPPDEKNINAVANAVAGRHGFSANVKTINFHSLVNTRELFGVDLIPPTGMRIIFAPTGKE